MNTLIVIHSNNTGPKRQHLGREGGKKERREGGKETKRYVSIIPHKNGGLTLETT